MEPVALIIPARYQSSRFPGKPLATILGKPMLGWVWQRCIQVLPEKNVFVATDDERIADFCRNSGIRYVMTGNDCLTGTDRVFQASRDVEAQIYINVQGDEPLISPADIQTVIHAAQGNPDCIINAMCPINNESDFCNPTIPKVVTRLDGRLLYMSRAPIPIDKNHNFRSAMKQVCIYAFPKSELRDFASVGHKTPLESIEDIEILRFLEMGKEVLMVEVSGSSIAVDTPDDLHRVETVLHATT